MGENDVAQIQTQSCKHLDTGPHLSHEKSRDMFYLVSI